jgi:PAS domain S-box-containing protein
MPREGEISRRSGKFSPTDAECDHVAPHRDRPDPAVKRGLTFQTIVAYGVLLAVVVGAFVVLAVAVSQLRGAGSADTHSAQVVATANGLEKATLDLETGLRGYLLAGKPRFLAPYRSARSEYPVLAAQLAAETAGDPAQHARALAIGAAVRGYARGWAARLVAEARTDLRAARNAEASGGGKRRVDEIRTRFAAFLRAQERVTRSRSDHARHVGALALGLALGCMALCALMLIAYAFGFRRGIVRPVQRLADAASRVGRGELSTRVPEEGRAEVGDLAAGFNAMAASLETQRDELESQTEELEAQTEELEAQQDELASALATVEAEKRQSELLQRLGDALAEASGVAEVADVALRSVADRAGAEVGAMYVSDDQEEGYVLASRRGLSADELAPMLAAGDGLAGRALVERRTIAVSYGNTTLELPGLVSGKDAQHELHLPLLHGTRTLGVISLGRARDEAFSLAEVSLLETLAERTAVVVAEALSVRAVEALAQQLETLLGSTEEGIYTMDTAGRITLVNSSALALTGFAEEELLGRNAHELLHHTRPDGTPYPQEECPIHSVVETGEPCRIDDDSFWRADGTPFPVEYSASPLREGGEIVGAVVTFVDIAARKRVERQRDVQHAVARVLAGATSTREVLPQLLQVVADGFGWQLGLSLYRDESGEIRCFASYAAPGFEREAARRAENPLGSVGPAGASFDLVEPVLWSSVDPATGLGDERLAAAVAVPIVGPSGELAGVAEFFAASAIHEEGLLETLGSIADQTAQFIERKRAEALAEQMRQDFVATVSHELRTPLTSIEGWLHVVLSEEPGPLNDDQRKFLETVRRNSQRLSRLVGDLLVARQIETGKLTLELEDIDALDVLREAVELVGAAAAEKGVELEADVRGLAPVHGDRLRLLQLFNNLLSNAVKFTPAGGRVEVAVETGDGTCTVTVSDSGIGIPVADRGRLFERFFRASSAREQGVAGTGLGLAISRAIAESHGGTIRLVEREGPGTAFAVELPLAVREGARA